MSIRSISQLPFAYSDSKSFCAWYDLKWGSGVRSVNHIINQSTIKYWKQRNSQAIRSIWVVHYSFRCKHSRLNTTSRFQMMTKNADRMVTCNYSFVSAPASLLRCIRGTTATAFNHFGGLQAMHLFGSLLNNRIIVAFSCTVEGLDQSFLLDLDVVWCITY